MIRLNKEWVYSIEFKLLNGFQSSMVYLSSYDQVFVIFGIFKTESYLHTYIIGYSN